MRGIDRALGGLEPGVYILAGRPSMGKTSLALQMACNIAAAGHGVVFFTIEMSAEQLGLRAATMQAEVELEALKQGKVDAYFGDAMSLSFWLIGTGSDNCCQFSGGPHLERFYFGDGLAIATARNNTVLLANLNYALSEIIGSPQFADLYERFFPLGFY